MDNFAIPGFQTPSHPKLADRVIAGLDGRIEFAFLSGLPLDTTMPRFDVYISNDQGTQVTNLAKLLSGNYVYEMKDELTPTKAFWFRILPSELRVLPGTYRLRFLVAEQELATRSVTVPNSPIAQRVFPEQAYPNGPLVQ